MSNTWLWSDPHAGHANIISFLRNDGVTRLRHEFWHDDGTEKGRRDVAAMNQAMIDNYNKVVRPGDWVYWGGDIAFGLKDYNEFLSRLIPCNWVLVRGNHDVFDTEVYLKRFRGGVYGTHEFKKLGFILSHYPLHSSQVTGTKGGFKVNVHGHIHANLVKKDNGQVDPRYMNICVEHTGYGLVHIDEVLERVAEVS